MLSEYVSFLRALYLIHQNNHWLCSGEDFYSKHQLFQRLYESTLSDLDTAAEKSVGLTGKLDVNPAIMSKIIDTFCPDKFEGDMVKCSIEAEKAFLRYSTYLYDSIKDSEDMTLGLDDMIMSIANNHEEHVYLLSRILI